jgi:transcriptional regulator with XRE-family HTH domain
VELREKLVQLRALAGERRGLGRPMTQTEVAMALRLELGLPLSQAYLSQLERGKRVHLSNTSREALARFFQVHPGYLVSDLSDPAIGYPAPETLQQVPGLALAPDLVAPSRMRGITWIGNPQAEKKKKLMVAAPARYARLYPPKVTPAMWGTQVKPGQAHGALTDRYDRSRDLVSRLCDHPEAERVLVLVEQILYLPPRDLTEVEKLMRSFHTDGKEPHGQAEHI